MHLRNVIAKTSNLMYRLNVQSQPTDNKPFLIGAWVMWPIKTFLGLLSYH